MGNISSVIGRPEEVVEELQRNNQNHENLSEADYISLAAAGLELNQNDYQMTLHQYLSRRYAERYTHTTYEYTQERLRTHETGDTTRASLVANRGGVLSKTSSFNHSAEDVIVLSLKGKNLKEIPHELFEQTEVTNLDLSNNDLTMLPKGFKKLQNLTRLSLGGNQLISLPEDISNLKNLTWLDFTNNRISQIPESFASLKKLTSLGASDCRLTEFPKVICQMKGMRKLGIFNNLLTGLPKEIGNLRMMTKLDLSGNSLTLLPDEIGNLTELTWLNLSQNQLQSIPESMSKLTKLKELGLAHNKLKRLPDLSNLDQLTLLPVFNNELEELGEWVGKMAELSKLDLSCNNLKTVPSDILMPPKLTFLNLRKNKLKEFPDQCFDKRINALVRVPASLTLATVDVRENELDHLPLALIGPALVELKTSSNPWRVHPSLSEDQQVPTKPIEVPSLLDLACSTMIQTEKLRHVVFSTTPSIQIRILQNTHRCQQCEKLSTLKGIDCMLWRATTDSAEVPFKANVCRVACMKTLDAIPI